MEPIPVVLVGEDFWRPLYEFMKNTLYQKYETIDKDDLKIFHIVDTPEEAAEVVRTSVERIYF